MRINDEPHYYQSPDHQFALRGAAASLALRPPDAGLRAGGGSPAGGLRGGFRRFDDPGIFVEIPLVNQIRPRVKAWREAGYPDVTSTTRRLLE
jgi:hypothetical protein